MLRRANRSVPLLWIIFLGLFIALTGAGIYGVRQFLENPYRGIPELPVAQYVDDSLSLRGNTYTLTGRVENELGWSDKAGRLFSFASDIDGRPFHLAILLPGVLSDTNVQKGQNFELKVIVVGQGLLQAIQIQKV